MGIETRHVRLDYVNALAAKKDLLNAEINLLHIVRKMKAYRMLRKKEMAGKNKLRIELGKLRKSMDSLEKQLPAEGIKEDKRKNRPRKVEEVKNLDSELMDIKRKLAKLGKK